LTTKTGDSKKHSMLASKGRDIERMIQSVVATLEEDIVFGRLSPRERLVEDDLLMRFGLKRHVVRQVLLELEHMGLVERKKNVGALVKSYTVKEVIDLYAVREIIETNCVRKIAMPVPADRLDQLIAIQRQHDVAAANSDPHVAFRVNITFHKALFALSDNSMLTDMISEAAQRAHIIRSLTLTTPHYLEQARQDHWNMIEALKNGDHERLASLCREHLIPSRDAYIQQHRAFLSRESETGMMPGTQIAVDPDTPATRR